MFGYWMYLTLIFYRQTLTRMKLLWSSLGQLCTMTTWTIWTYVRRSGSWTASVTSCTCRVVLPNCLLLFIITTTRAKRGQTADLEIVQSVSRNFNVLLKNFCKKREYIGSKTRNCAMICFWWWGYVQRNELFLYFRIENHGYVTNTDITYAKQIIFAVISETFCCSTL